MPTPFNEHLSSARIKTYEDLNPTNSINSYLNNVALSEAFYPSIHFLEIILRNKISKTIAKIFGENWLELEEQMIPLEGRELENLKEVKTNLTKRGKWLDSDNITAELNFGFWISLFHKKYEAKIWQKKGCPERVFPNHGRTGLVLRVKEIREDLEKIRKLRNRIFHHEPIINLDPSPKYLHDLIYFYLRSMAPDLVTSILSIDRFNKITLD